MRLAAGLHALVRSGDLPELATLYPPHPMPSPSALRSALARSLDHPSLLDWLDRTPQTNEVGRSAVVLAGLSVVAAETGTAIDLLDIGCSAGLNLWPDRYAITLGDAVHGDAASPVRLAPAWHGGAPPRTPVRIVARRGVDLAPPDPHDVADRARLLAYTWADQPERLARADAALALAAGRERVVDPGDAGIWCSDRLTRPGVPGVARVLFNTIAFQYFDAATAALVRCAAGAAGRVATRAAPFAWLRLEFAADHVEAPAAVDAVAGRHGPAARPCGAARAVDRLD